MVVLVCHGVFLSLLPRLLPPPEWHEVPLCEFFVLLPLLVVACYWLADFLKISASLDLLFRFYISVWRHLLYLSHAYQYSCWGLMLGSPVSSVANTELQFSVVP